MHEEFGMWRLWRSSRRHRGDGRTPPAAEGGDGDGDDVDGPLPQARRGRPYGALPHDVAGGAQVHMALQSVIIPFIVNFRRPVYFPKETLTLNYSRGGLIIA